MVPSGEPTERTISNLAEALSPGDVLIDGGNSNYNGSMLRASFLKERGLLVLDVGTSEGMWGLKEGYSMMIGSHQGAFGRLELVFQALAWPPGPDRWYGYVGRLEWGSLSR